VMNGALWAVLWISGAARRKACTTALVWTTQATESITAIRSIDTMLAG